MNDDPVFLFKPEDRAHGVAENYGYSEDSVESDK